jgi:hypothetical protein
VTSLRLNPEAVVWQEIDGELVAIDLGTSEYLTVNGAAAVAWPLLVEGATLDQLVEALCSRYTIEEAQARADMLEFVTTLRQRRLVTEA